MGLWRLSWRTLAFVAVSTLGLLAVALSLPLAGRLASKRRGVRRFVVHHWARAVSRIVGLSIQVVGKAPERPFFLVTNHLSYYDVLVIDSLSAARFVAKAEVRGWPGFSLLCRAGGTLFVNRESKRDALRVGEAIRQAVAEGDSVVLFPEGTSSSGCGVLPFKTALLAPAAGALDVHAAAIRYQTSSPAPPAYQSVAWWGSAPLLPHLFVLLQVPRIEAEISFARAPLRRADRKELARGLQTQVEDLFEPMVSPLELGEP